MKVLILNCILFGSPLTVPGVLLTGNLSSVKIQPFQGLFFQYLRRISTLNIARRLYKAHLQSQTVILLPIILVILDTTGGVIYGKI